MKPIRARGWCVMEFGVANDTAGRDLNGLTELGLLEQIGKGRAVRYVVKATDNRLTFFEIRPMSIGTKTITSVARTVEPEFAVSDGFATTVWRKTGEVEAAQPESQPESLEQRVLALLANGPLSKAAISGALGQKEISGHLNQVIRVLLADQTLEYTVPDKPTSRLQQYRLTDKGRVLLATLGMGTRS